MSSNHYNYDICKHTTKTGVHLGNFKLAKADGELIREFDRMDVNGLEQAFIDDGFTLEQRDFTVNDYLNNDGSNENAVKIIGNKLGNGSFGTAFRCTFWGSEYVIKIPNSLWRGNILTSDDEGFLMRDIAVQRTYDILKLGATRSFRLECRFNEKAVDPFTHRRLRGHQAGRSLPKLSKQQYLEIIQELNTMKSHEGYEHIHKIVGFVPELPVLFSEPCVGSLGSLIERADITNIFAVEGDKLSSAWLELAKQMGDAIDYLDVHGSIVHMDIKPDNILYNVTANQYGLPAYHWKLSDFGICVDKKNDRDRYTTSYAGGTGLYLPRAVMERKTDAKWVFDAYECSLYSYMLTILQSIKFNLPDGYLWNRLHIFMDNLPNGANLYDYAACDPDIFKLLHDAKHEDEPANALSDDKVFGFLSGMFFSEEFNMADTFIEFMMALREELIERNVQMVQDHRQFLQECVGRDMAKRRRI
jgi:serine/threonine protein kinase